MQVDELSCHAQTHWLCVVFNLLDYGNLKPKSRGDDYLYFIFVCRKLISSSVKILFYETLATVYANHILVKA